MGNGPTRVRIMAARSERTRLEIIFGRAFLLELERGDLETAQVFARAFLHNHAPPAGALV